MAEPSRGVKPRPAHAAFADASSAVRREAQRVERLLPGPALRLTRARSGHSTPTTPDRPDAQSVPATPTHADPTSRPATDTHAEAASDKSSPRYLHFVGSPRRSSRAPQPPYSSSPHPCWKASAAATASTSANADTKPPVAGDEATVDGEAFEAAESGSVISVDRDLPEHGGQ